jgi:hypothetical protein
MRRTSNSAMLWRCGVAIVAVLATAQLAIEVFHAPRVLRVGLLTEQLFEGRTFRERGPTTFVVDSVPATSPLLSAGVVPGDRLRWDEPIGRWYNLAAGDTVSLTVIHGDESRRIDVTAPAASALPRHQVANYVTDIASRVLALVIGAMIGWRRPNLTTFRALAASGLLYAFAFPYSAPAGLHLAGLDLIASVAQELALGALVFFAMNYPDDKPIGLRATLKRYYPWLFGLQVAITLFFYVRLYDGFFEPAAAWFFRAYLVVLPALFFWAIVLAWRQSHGDSRVRLQWILATLGTIMSLNLIGTLNDLAGSPIPAPDMALVLNAAGLAAEAGFVYAILRRRIFDFGLAVNRTLVFGIVGAILLGVFQIAHGVVSEFLHFDDKNKTILLSAVLAVAVYLSFNQLKKIVEKVVDRIFFNSWAISEEDLKHFVAEAKHASDAEALSKLLVASVDRFTEGAGCAVFRRDDGDNYLRKEGTLASMPEKVSANDEAVLAMRAHDKAVRMRDSSSTLRAALALPMAHRGELFGFVLLGPRNDGEPYRTDQIDVLEFAAHEVGLDFYALKLEQLANQVAVERRNAETLRAQLQTAMAMAKNAPLEGSS